LELQKCFWYLIYWQWIDDHSQMAPNLSCLGIIALTGGPVPNYTVIPRHKVWVAKCMLGVLAAPDGNYQKEAELLLHKATHMLFISLLQGCARWIHSSFITVRMSLQ
jgi:hypothetical protein